MNAETGSTHNVGRAARPRNIAALMVALMTAVLAFQLNASMLSPALVTIERELGTTATSVAATQTAFFTAAALFALFLPRLGDLIGRRRVLTGLLAVMTVGCVVAALAPNVPVLFVGRLVQGVSGSIVPLCLIMLRVEVPNPRRYGTLMGVVAAVNGGIAGFDALLGGFLATHLGFASVFWVMGGIAVAAAVLVRLVVPESTASERTPMDWAGTLLFVVSVGSLLVAVNELSALGDADFLLVGILGVVAVGAFALLWRTESRSPHPLVPTDQLRDRASWSVIGTAFLTLGGVFAVMNGVIPAFAQDGVVGLGMNAEEAAWWVLTPYAIAGLLVGPLSGRLAPLLGYRTVLRVGLAASVVVLVLFALTVTGASPVLLLLLSVAIGVTYAGIANIMLNGLSVVLSPDDRPGSLPGLAAGGFNLGAATSFLVIYAAQTLYTDAAGQSSAAGYVAALVTGAVLMVAALLLSLAIPRPERAEVRA
ncbi:MFS transporter [Pseudonocardia ailaonensis]|uniref:MFS transporter n=1 Tax=Pseudonocardia ailaonensis TaxID=367279 RepID=A0ABN2MLT7_9PSEU